MGRGVGLMIEFFNISTTGNVLKCILSLMDVIEKYSARFAHRQLHFAVFSMGLQNVSVALLLM